MRRERSYGPAFIFALVYLLMISTGRGQVFQLESAGARVGIAGGSSSKNFHEAELFADWDLPFRWDLGSRLSLQSRVEVSTGWLGERGDNSAIENVGPCLVLAREHFPLSLAGGVNATVLSRSEFASRDFGILFQFTSYVGVNWDFAAHMRLGYRFQHMSNAGLNGHNPGLNLHVFSLGYVF